MKSLRSSWFPVLLGLIILFLILSKLLLYKSVIGKTSAKNNETEGEWQAPDINLVPHTEAGDLIRYGRDLIVNTSYYFGPRGSIAAITNGMNCQNCHVEAGTRAFGNSFAAVASTYPRYRERSGITESIEYRVNDCMKRSLNGKPIDSLGKEMRAIVAYLKWLGRDVPKGVKPAGSGIPEIPYLARAADPEKGKAIFENHCRRCHGNNGEGEMYRDGKGYKYPPLWGHSSFNTGAGMFRISRLASFIRYNMPFTAVQVPPQLTDEEAWDAAAFIISRPRDFYAAPQDWPDISSKPVDHPFGPYTDGFSELQHQYGPFDPITKARGLLNRK